MRYRCSPSFRSAGSSFFFLFFSSILVCLAESAPHSPVTVGPGASEPVSSHLCFFSCGWSDFRAGKRVSFRYPRKKEQSGSYCNKNLKKMCSLESFIFVGHVGKPDTDILHYRAPPLEFLHGHKERERERERERVLNELFSFNN